MLQIITDPKLLSRKSTRVAKIDDIIRNICKSLIDTMIGNDGIGIAAPQCGILKRIIIATVKNNVLALINPEIIEFSNEMECDLEGCLSLPGEKILVQRHKIIRIKYRNLRGKPVCETFSGFDARVIQHEIGHLDGKIIKQL